MEIISAVDVTYLLQVVDRVLATVFCIVIGVVIGSLIAMLAIAIVEGENE